MLRRPRSRSRVRLTLVALVIAVLGVAGCTPSLSATTASKSHHKTRAKGHAGQHKHHKRARPKGHRQHGAHHKAHHSAHKKAHHERHHVVRHHHLAAAQDTLVVEPDAGFSAVYRLIGTARHSIEMTMYELADQTAEQDLAAAARRGVAVRVILDRRETTHDSDAQKYLSSHGVKVVWSSSSFDYTHQKTMVVDKSAAMIMSANLTSRYYATSRDFLVTDTNAADIAAIVRVFNADFAHKAIKPGDGHDLVWSPTDSQRQMIGVINGASKSLRIYNEEMGDTDVDKALISAARRGVDVMICVENQDHHYDSVFAELAHAGVHVAYFSSSDGFYIHAKVIEADYGTKHARVFIGSENFSNTSLNFNRELGLIVSTPTIMSAISRSFAADFAKGKHVT